MYVLTSVRRYRWCVFFWVAGCLSAQGAATAQIPAVAPDSATWRWAFQPTLGTLSLQNSRYPGQLTDGTSPAVGIQFRESVAPAESWGVQPRVVIQQKDVRLQRRVAAAGDVLTQRDHVIQRADRRNPHRLGPTQTVGSAV